LLDEQLNVVVDVLLELADGLHTEGMRDSLALAGMFFTVASIEKTATNRDKGIIEIAVG
jgi:hypothetical protein